MKLSLTNDDFLLTAAVYVAFKSKQPDKKTQRKVTQEMQENDIDDSQLVVRSADNC
jgi:hypothetical protein